MDNGTKKIVIIVIALLLSIAMVIGLVYTSLNNNTKSNMNSNNTTSDANKIVSVEDSSGITIDVSDDEKKYEYTDYTAKVDLSNMSVEGNGVKISENTVTISNAGVFYFTGTSKNCNIVVEADKNSEVILVFDNANITSINTSVINIVKAKEAIINLKEGSTNTFTDSSNYTVFTEEEEPDSTVFSKADLVVNGSGKLVINANYKDGIASKDGLKILGASIEINSKDDGIRGKDYTYVKDGDIIIKSEGDGIKSTNGDTEDVGYIIIDGGKINIESGADAIQAETVLTIKNNPTINIKTNGEIGTKTNNFYKPGTVQNKDLNTSDKSSKALKAGKEITIESGNITIDSTDDAIHSNNYVIINGGNIKITSGDDGIHADNNILINGGTIDIVKSYEGIESSYIKINNGSVSVVASDDGINVAGGKDSSSFGRNGANSFVEADSGRMLVINGGDLTVNSAGDGVDSNGSIEMNGGNVTVSGTTGGGNGALDYDGSFKITGGTLIAYGGSDMWQDTSTSSTQASVTFSYTGSAGDDIVLKDETGKELISIKTVKSYARILLSSDKLEQGKKYTLYVNGNEVTSKEVTSVVNGEGDSGGFKPGMGRNMDGNMDGFGGMNKRPDRINSENI